MATVASLLVDLRASTAAFQSDMRAASSAAAQSMAAIRQEAARTSDSISALNKAAASFIGFEAIKAGVQSLLDAQRAIQQIHYSLVSATGSAPNAEQAFGQVSEIAQRLGLDLQSSALGFSSMSAAANANGVSMKDQLALFEGLARSSTVLHLSTEQSGRAITALSQIFGKGKIQAEELRQQLGDAIPGVVPRFQAAVMAMNQGTALAGKSFDQLLQDGDLSVTKYLPALVDALNQTGKGAEQAAGGLNAEMNRLSTAWFKLKADLSTGLVSDATIGGVRLLSQNLDSLTALAGVAGGVITARLAGTGLSKASGAISGFAQQQQEARAAAAEVADLAAKRAAETAAQVSAVEASMAQTNAWRAQAAAAVEDQRAVMAVAFAHNEAAQATLEHTSSAAALSANFKAQDAATAAAAIAQRELAQTQANLSAAISSGNVAAARQLELEVQLAKAKAADAAATEALAVANARQAETQAATSAAGLLARGASSLGSAALALVGGPWGAAALAIGGVSYAIYQGIQASQQYRAETQQQVQSLQALQQQLTATAQSYGSLDTPLNFGKAFEDYNSGTKQIADTERQLADLRAEADRLNGVLRASAASGGIGSSIADANTQRQLDEVNDRIAEVSSQLNGATAASQQLAAQLAGVLTPALAGVKAGFANLGQAGGVNDFLDRLNGIGDVVANRQKAVQEAEAAINQYGNDIAAADKAATAKLLKDGKTQAEQVEAMLSARIAAINTKYGEGSAQAQKLINDAQAAATPALQHAAQVDAADAAKKAATAAAAEAKKWSDASKELANSLQQTHNELQAQLDSTTKLTPEQKKLQDILGGTSEAYNHATAAERAKMLATAQSNAELSKQILLQQQAMRDAQAWATVQDNLTRIAQQSAQQRQDSLASIGQGSQQSQDQAALTAIQRQYDDLMASADKDLRKGPDHGGITQGEYDKEIALYKQQLADELAAERNFFAQRDAMQADWSLGARAALQDYAASARDIAGQTKSAFQDAFGGLEDALVTFVQTGKLSFTSLANSIIADLIRMQTRAALSGLFQYLGSAIYGYSSGTPATGGTTSSTGGGYTANLPFGGGRASGGPTAGGTVYEVAEHGRPELYQSGGRTYLLSGQNGYVTPAGGASNVAASVPVGAGSGAAPNITINNHAGADVSATAQRNSSGGWDIDVLVKQLEAAMTGRVNSGKSTLLPALANRMGTTTAANLSS